jgi:hypothetical protein
VDEYVKGRTGSSAWMARVTTTFSPAWQGTGEPTNAKDTVSGYACRETHADRPEGK